MGELQLAPEDEFWHEVSSEHPLWRESYYFDFYDPETTLSGFTSLGYRVNKGYMGSVTGLVWNDSVFLRKDYGRPTKHKKIVVEGLKYIPETPLEKWRIRQLDPMNKFELEPNAMQRNPDEFPTEKDPLYDIDVDLTFVGTHEPVDYYTTASQQEMEIVSPVYSRHYEQACEVTGQVTIGNETIEVNGPGQRDHSWGIRDWRGPDSWVWLGASFDANTAVSFIQITNQDKAVLDGYLHMDGQTTHVKDISLDTDYRDNSDKQDSLTCDIVDSQGREYRIYGEAETIIPIDFEYEDEIGKIRRGPTTFQNRDTGQVGYGWSEYLISKSR